MGVLCFASKCSPASRTFMRTMFRALRRKGKFVRLNRGIKADLAWWLKFWSEFNGVSLTLDEEFTELRFFTDASFLGFGACFDTPDGPQFFCGRWTDFGLPPPEELEASGWHISELEMLAVAMAAETWGHYLARRKGVIRVDNEASVHTINNGRCHDGGMMVVMRELFHIAAKHSFMLRCRHIGTKDNVLADAPSRDDLEAFYAFAKAEFGWERADITRVECTLDVRAVIERMERAHAWMARNELELARRAKNREHRQAKAARERAAQGARAPPQRVGASQG